MRVFIGPTEIAGISRGLLAGFLDLNIEADMVLGQDHPFAYAPVKSGPRVGLIWLALGDKLRQAEVSGSRSRRIYWLLWRLWSVVVLLWAIRRYDSFIFPFGNTITNTSADLYLLRLFKKRSVFLFVGSDARPPYIDGPTCQNVAALDPKKLRSLTRKLSRRLWAREATGICINIPFTAQFHRRNYINWFHIGLPRAIDATKSDAQPSAAVTAGRPVRILHSPSAPAIKGTAQIEAAIASLNDKGHAIEFTCLRGVQNSEVVRQLESCDFVVDQIYSDLPMATLATEAAFFGKPTVVAGYAACYLDNFPDWPIAPTVFVHPDELEAAIERMIIDVKARLELGQQAKLFVERNWSPRAVAGKIRQLLDGDIPDHWWLAPSAVQYVEGCGMPVTRGRAAIRSLVEAYGPSALCLDANEPLRAAMIEHAFGECTSELRGSSATPLVPHTAE